MVKPVLTPTEAASYLRLAVGTLANWRWRGEGPPYVLYGRRVRYRRSDLEAWMEELMHRSPTDPLPPPPTPRAALHALAPRRRRASRAQH